MLLISGPLGIILFFVSLLRLRGTLIVLAGVFGIYVFMVCVNGLGTVVRQVSVSTPAAALSAEWRQPGWRAECVAKGYTQDGCFTSDGRFHPY